MIYVYFSFKDDATTLAMSVARLREIVGSSARIYIINDAAAPIPHELLPHGTLHRLSHYERGGSGTGIPALRGQLETIRDLLRDSGATFALKIDSDIWVNTLSPFNHEPTGTPPADFLACEGSRALLPMGCTYRLTRWAVDTALRLLDERPAHSWPPATYAEAITLWHLLTTTHLSLRLIPASLGYLSGFYLSHTSLPHAVSAAGLIHCGEPHLESSILTRASRELTRTRMLLLQTISTHPQTN